MAGNGTDYREEIKAMKEIFLALSLIGAVLLGITLFQGQKADNLDKESVHAHIGWALGTAIYLMVLHGVVITYFMGTGFAVKEAVEEHGVSEEFLARARAFKMRVFPVTTLAIFLVVLSIILGTAAFTSRTGEAGIHRTLAYLALFLNLGVFYLQFQAIWENGKLLEEINAALPEEAPASGLPTPPGE